MNKKAAICP